ncbi:MAG: minor capsid protein [Bacilli bacterium]|nr:minor capsid protein [Bacilli bacterium]
MNYWQKRLIRAQNAITDKTISDIQKQLKKYYIQTMNSIISDFEATYDKLLTTMEYGREATPADLYKLDRYWQMQSQLKNEMQKMGDKEIELLSKHFEKQWVGIYNSFAIVSDKAFSTVSIDNAKTMIKTSWLSDGKNFSQRIWNNVEKLTETLNENLIQCITSGKKTTELKQLLQHRFNVSYNNADTLIKTETAHIQTQASAQRYIDYGLKYYEFLADTDEKTCSKCKALDRKVFLYSEMEVGVNAPPIHPNDRCTIIPVFEKQ